MQHYSDWAQDTAGNAIAGASVSVYAAGTSSLSTIYSDNIGTTTSNPLTTGSDGNYDFYAPTGRYDLVITKSGYTFVAADTAGISLFDPATDQWVPAVGGTATYTLRSATYYKVGLLVFIDGIMTINVLGTGSTTIMSGLPFAAAADTALVAGVSSGLAVSPVSLEPFISSGTIEVTFYGRTAGATASSSQAIFGNGASIRISGCYLATT